ncbi:hypothetical protein EYC80_002071 [Monilinia laxa]|uniref:Uncharacterized protein n=1 Tax=Monilinia laxa TaxID=61186 RepID=A0A5N6K6Y0_MONLA|nr:hypothetical protein EYC80_002071 [Monilinia laxa]
MGNSRLKLKFIRGRNTRYRRIIQLTRDAVSQKKSCREGGRGEREGERERGREGERERGREGERERGRDPI